MSILNDVGRSDLPTETGLVASPEDIDANARRGVCCQRSTVGGLATHLAFTWQCLDDPKGDSQHACLARGGIYRGGASCERSPCPTEANEDGIPCCLPAKGCAPMPSYERCTSAGGSPLPPGSTCARDGAACFGACCHSTSFSAVFGSQKVESEKVGDLSLGFRQVFFDSLLFEHSVRKGSSMC